jgi:membrane-associated phospholipid phosphatase
MMIAPEQAQLELTGADISDVCADLENLLIEETADHFPGVPGIQEVADRAFPRRWDGRVAYVISQAISPPVLVMAVMVLIAATAPGTRGWALGSWYVSVAIGLPMLYLILLIRRGIVADLDVSMRHQRLKPMIFTVACMGLAWMGLAVGGAPRLMEAVAIALWGQTALIFAITMRWKISLHSAAVAGVTMLAWKLWGSPLPLLIGVPVVSWSRVWLRRHTVAQVIGGALLGWTIFSVMWALL